MVCQAYSPRRDLYSIRALHANRLLSRDTWNFLDHRIRDAFDCRKTLQEATQLAGAVGAGLGNTLQAFLRR
eukprot:Gb_03421 [translate_table: standard]